jgi:hypothetical protein
LLFSIRFTYDFSTSNQSHQDERRSSVVDYGAVEPNLGWEIELNRKVNTRTGLWPLKMGNVREKIQVVLVSSQLLAFDGIDDRVWDDQG